MSDLLIETAVEFLRSNAKSHLFKVSKGWATNFTALADAVEAQARELARLQSEGGIGEMLKERREANHRLRDSLAAQVRRVTELEQEVQDLEAGCAHCGDLGYVVITATGEEADCCCYVGQVRSQARELAYERDRATAVEDKHGKFCQAAVRALGADELGGASIIAEIESQARRLEAATGIIQRLAVLHEANLPQGQDALLDGYIAIAASAAAFLAGDAEGDGSRDKESQ